MSDSSRDIGLVVFDLGKVLLDFDYLIAARNLSERARLTADQIYELLLRTPLLVDYERGELASAEFYSAMVRQAGFLGSFAEFSDRFADIFSPIVPMIELVAQVQASSRPIALLSNTNELAVEFIRAHFPFYAQFTHRVLSYEHKVMKPDPALYRVIEETSSCPPDRILFLDDRPENVQAAQFLGWHAFVHHTPENSRAQFAQLGLLP